MTTAFFETYERLCSERGMSDNAIAAEIGLSDSTVTSWKQGALPRRPTIKKVADYFGIIIEEVMGYAQKEKPTTVSGDGLKEVIAIFSQLNPDNYAKLLELGRLYLADQNKNEGKK